VEARFWRTPASSRPQSCSRAGRLPAGQHWSGPWPTVPSSKARTSIDPHSTAWPVGFHRTRASGRCGPPSAQSPGGQRGGPPAERPGAAGASGRDHNVSVGTSSTLPSSSVSRT
jgi:hypothetical protein